MTNKNQKMDQIEDERTLAIRNKALANANIFAIIVTSSYMIYKFINKQPLGFELPLFTLAISLTIVTTLITLMKDKNFVPLVLDERTKTNLTFALAIPGFITLLAAIIISGYAILQENKQLYYEITFFTAIIGSAIFITNLKYKHYELPTVFNKEIPLDKFKDSAKYRRKFYFKKTFGSALVNTIFLRFVLNNLFFKQPVLNSKLLTFILEFLIIFIIFLTLNILWTSYNIKKHQALEAELED